MPRKLILPLLCLLLLIAPSVKAAVYFVDAGKANNTGNGLSWANAKKDLQAALNAAAAGDEIWVKAGTYLPTLEPDGTTSTGDPRNKSFYLATKNMKVYGGFTGTETLLSQRNAIANITVLSGDLDGPGGTADAYHVFVTFERTTACIVDGFTIKTGRANGNGNPQIYYVNGINGTAPSYYNNKGGGVYNVNSSPTISNCIITDNIATSSGSGMQNTTSSPATTNCTFSSNSSTYGAAMDNGGNGTPTVSGCTFNNNTGGGIYTIGDLTVTNSTFSSNTGRGIACQTSNLTVSGCTFNNNDAGSGNSGGAIACFTGNSTLRNFTLSNSNFNNNIAGSSGGAVSIRESVIASITGCNFTGNTATGGYGGAVHTDGNGRTAVTSTTFSNCTFSSNSAYRGGAVYIDLADQSLSGSSFSNNTAGENGGGMYSGIGSDAFSITNCTFTGNTAATSGGGIYNDRTYPAISSCTFTGNNATVSAGGIYTKWYNANFKNCIISGNTSNNASLPDLYFDGGSITYSLIGPANNPSPYGYGTGVVRGSPFFVNAASPAGPDGIFRTADDGLRIGCTSAARDAGIGTTPTTDILGNARVGVIDMGAYESPGTGCTNTIQYVDASMATNGNGYSWNSPKRDLQEAINAVDAGGQVWVKAGTYLPTLDANGNATPIDPRDKSFYLTSKDVKIYGGFVGTETLVSQRNPVTNRTILSGNLDGNAGTNDAYHVLIMNNRTTASGIDGFTITGGRANGNGSLTVAGTVFTQSDGGGIVNNNSSPTISNCIFLNNSATFYAGGMYNISSNPSISSCVFSNNAAGKGGGLLNSNSSPSISSCTFAGNTASSFGGGIYGFGTSGGTVTNCILSGNTGGPANRQNIYKDPGTVFTVSYTLIGDYSSTATNNYTASNILIGDPFVEVNNPAGADAIVGTADDGLRIGCSSPARDAGTGTTPTNDILGNPRVGAIDLGAYEYQGTTCPTLIYVNSSRPDNSGTGTSWATAKKDVQAGINEVAAGGSVWVKAGTYLPTLDANGNAAPIDNRDKAFYITTKDVKLYGGFAGTETQLSDRNVVTNVTTLSGNLDGNAGTNDAYHVIITGNRTVTSVVDGFTFTGGRANGSGTVSTSGLTFDRSKGGGMYNLNSNPTLGSCIFNGNTATTDGGGMYNKSSNPAIIGCTFSNNTAGTGGGLYNSAAIPIISSCTFSTNTASTNGGGLLNDNSSPQITGGTFNNNTANTSGGGVYNLNSSPAVSTSTFNANNATVNGGGIYNDGSNAAVTNCILTGNTAGNNGGGMYNVNSSPSVSSCTFASNTATQNGGGIYNNASGAVLTSCAFGSNAATQNGGGIYNLAANPVLSNCVFSGNTSGNNGGGLFNESSIPGISSTSFSANTATSTGGGVYSDATSGGTVTNTILSGNMGGPANRQNLYKEAGTGVLTVNYSVVSDYSSTATNNYTGSTIIAGDPLFVDAANPAGPDGIFRTSDDGLRITSCASPARDAGTGTTPATDIVGNVRVNIIDIGAYENPANGCPRTLYVDAGKPNNTGVGDTWVNAKKDLQAAINAAAASGDQIWVKAGTYLPTLDPNGSATPADARDKTIYLTTKELKLYGGFAGTETLLSQRVAGTNITTLSGDLDGPGGTADAYHVLITGGRTAACVVDGFTIAGGRANSPTFLTLSGFNFLRSGGGGINNTNSSPTISNCIFSNNSSNSEGGGMFNSAASPQISSCTFTSNSSGNRGGGLSTTGGNPIVSNCAFISNTSTFNGGGAASSGSTSNISMRSCSFIGNTSNQNGGGLSNGNFSTMSASNCSFSANTAISGGGFASINSGNFAMSNCTFSANNASSNGGGIYNSNNGSGSITNCILRGNTGGPINRQNIYKDTGTTVLTVSYSIIADYNSTAINNYTSGANILPVDPLFVNAANPAGPDGKLGTADDGIALSSCSPAVNAGNTTMPPLPQDILNNNRVGGYDMGAYEYQSAATLPILASTNTTDTRMAYLGEVTSFGDCSNFIATLRSQGSALVSGMVTAKLYVQNTVLMQGQIPYARRYYDITPTANANTATAQVTLYFTQADFDNYNSSRGSNLPLPSDGTDAAGNKVNIQIMQEHGISASGLPGSYTGWGGAGPAQIFFTPLSVVWNVQILRWEVIFPVTGFSGFFLNTVSGGVVPIKLLAFTAKRIKASLNIVEWKTVFEESGTFFMVERSGDGTTFNALGVVMSKGIFTGSKYLFDDNVPLEGDNYYRLKSTEPNGDKSYSSIVKIKNIEGRRTVIEAFPNPAYDLITIRCLDSKLLGSKAILSDMDGKVIRAFVLQRETLLNINRWAAGVYVLRTADGNTIRIVRK